MNIQKKRGQPLKDAKKKCSELISIYLTPEERTAIEISADTDLLSVSKFIRKKLKECGVI